MPDQRLLKELFRSKGSFSEWKERARRAESRLVRRYCLQKAYIDSDSLAESFLKFSEDIQGRKLDSDWRIQYFSFMTQRNRYRMLQAARGAWKSSIAVVDYSTWRIARDLFLSMQTPQDYLTNRSESRIRICMASETEDLAKRNARWALRAMRNHKYIYLAGDHRSRALEAKPWGVMFMMSAFRADASLGDPTLMPMGANAERTGFHFDIMLCDDLEAQRSSATPEMIENIYEFYRLLLSIMDPRGEMNLVCTRWHEDDIYARIEKENELTDDAEERYEILKIPAAEEDLTNLRFPEILSEKKLKDLKRKQGTHIFSCQYLLKPRPSDEKVFQPEYLKSIQPFMLRQKAYTYVTGDFAWTQVKAADFRRGISRIDFTVILTVSIDEAWNFIVTDWFRKRCATSEAIDELFRQHKMNDARLAILQKYDKRGLGEAIEQRSFELQHKLVPEWIAYPPDSGKDDRIQTILEPAFRAHKIYLVDTMMKWFANEEYLPFPQGKKDCLDALCNIVKFGKPPPRSRFREPLTMEEREIRMLKAGIDPDSKAETVWDL